MSENTLRVVYLIVSVMLYFCRFYSLQSLETPVSPSFLIPKFDVRFYSHPHFPSLCPLVLSYKVCPSCRTCFRTRSHFRAVKVP